MGQDEWRRCLHRAVFANTAVDRIVPGQDPDAGLDVTVESFFEWVIESGPFDGDVPVIPDAHFVDDLLPFIERKLFTVNTGHATVAYLGAAAGYTTLSDAIARSERRRDRDAGAAGDLDAAGGEARARPGSAARLSREDPAPLREPFAARHRATGRTPAAAEAEPARAVHRPSRRARRARPADRAPSSRRSARSWASMSRMTSRACRCTRSWRRRRARATSWSR